MDKRMLCLMTAMSYLIGCSEGPPSSNTKGTSVTPAVTLSAAPAVPESEVPPAGSTLKIGFTSTLDGESGPFMMNADGSNVTRLTDAPSVHGPKMYRSDSDNMLYVEKTDGSTSAPINSVGDCVSISRDGKKIAFQSRDTRPHPLVVMNFDGSQAQTIVNSMWAYTPVFSPDGSKIAFMGNQGDFEIYVVNTDGTNLQRLTRARGRDGGLAQGSWAPDGSKLTFMSERDGKPRQIYVMNSDGTNQIKLTTGTWPSWFLMGQGGTYQPRTVLREEKQ